MRNWSETGYLAVCHCMYRNAVTFKSFLLTIICNQGKPYGDAISELRFFMINAKWHHFEGS